MVTINTPNDVLRVLAENAEWKEAVRVEILTEELLALPGRFDSFVATTEAFMEEQRQVNANQAEFNAKTDAFMVKTDAFMDEQRQVNANTAEFIAEQKAFNTRIYRRVERMNNDMSNLRGDYARRNALDEAEDIAMDMGFTLIRALTRSDLRAMYEAGDTTGISINELRSFRRADLALEVADGDDATHYIVVEISYTADERDTGRALRNVDFIARFTGKPAHAAIASIRNDNRIQHLIDGGAIHWHELEDRTPAPE